MGLLEILRRPRKGFLKGAHQPWRAKRFVKLLRSEKAGELHLRLAVLFLLVVYAYLRLKGGL